MEEIVRRLRNRDKKSLNSLKESMPVKGISEEELTDEESESDADNLDLDIPAEDDTVEADEEGTDDSDPDSVGDSPDVAEEEEFTNPLDNSYAVRYKIGQRVVLTYSNGTKSKLSGSIDGYDKEGFYRIKWANGKTTSGLTDIALSDMIEETSESTCVCGSSNFVTEGNKLVCDVCGRVIRETCDESEDPLTTADKERPNGKKLIRSQAHDMDTALPECDTPKRSLADSIRTALKKKSIQESEELDIFSNLRDNLDNEFWTRSSEMLDDIRALGYDVLDSNAEYVVVAIEDDEGEDHQMQIPVGGTSRTLTLDFRRAEVL